MTAAVDEDRTTAGQMRRRVVDATRRGRRLASASGLILIACGVRGCAIAVDFGSFRVQSARGVVLFRSESTVFDLLGLTVLSCLAWLLVGVAVSRRGGVWSWLGVPSGILLAVAMWLWQPHDFGLQPFVPGPSVLADGALLALGAAALTISGLASGLVVGAWRRVAGAALLLGAVTFALMQTLPLDDVTPGTALAMAALSLGEPIMTAVLGVVLILGVRSSRRSPPSSAHRLVAHEALS